MTNKKRAPRPSQDEQHILEHLTVRPLQPHEQERFDQLIVQPHYLKSIELVGEHLRYVATYKGRWLALAAWAAAVWHLKARDAFIGWDDEQRRKRLPLLANNARLPVLPDGHLPNLMSRFMRLMRARLSEDWHSAWGHPLALVETFVDPQLYQGTAYKVRGWCKLGQSAGWKRSAEDFDQKHDRPKQLWVRERVKKACVKLRAPQLLPDWAKVEQQAQPRCAAKCAPIRSLVETLRGEVPEGRSPKGLAYPIAGMLALIAMAMFRGVRRGPQDLADYAGTLSKAQLDALGFRCHKHTGQPRRPRLTPFRDVLTRVDAQARPRARLLWQEQLLGPAQETVKDNQKERVQTLATLLTPGKFSPSAHEPDPRPDPRTQPRSV